MGVKYEDALAKLTELGIRKVDNFNQSSPERRLAAHSDGYCHGVCVDWIRRVLQGGRASYGPNPAKQNKDGYDYVARRTTQAKRQGHAYEQHRAIRAKVKSTHIAGIGKFNTMEGVYTAGLKVYRANSALGNAHVINLGPETITVDGKTVKLVPAMKELFGPEDVRGDSMQVGVLGELLQSLGSQMDSVGEQAESLRTKSATGTIKDQPTGAGDQKAWQIFGKLMDKEFEKKRSYAGIDLVFVGPQTNFGSLEETIASVTDKHMPNYENGRAMILGISFETDKGDSGHAVAMHWQPDNKHLLLEPNFGMFEYEDLDGKKSVRAALRYLFGEVYPKEAGIKSVVNQIEYMIYAPK